MQMIYNKTNILPQDGIALYYEKIIAEDEVIELYDALFNNIHWENERIIMFGKEIITKRKVAFFSDPSICYRYAGKTKIGMPWTNTLVTIKNIIESFTKESYNACLLNLYHNGEESMGWHSDNEKEIIANSSIASLSLGASRKFSFKHKISKETLSIELEDGSLLEMKGSVQAHWWHALLKSKKVTAPRINLTFRQMHTQNRMHEK
jgi:alkylated DNA repair dioxygenase AlkB